VHAYLCAKYGLPRDPKDFEEAVRILEGSFISIRGTKITYINPSFRDYLSEYLSDGAMLKDFAAAACRFDWAEAIWRFARRSREIGTPDKPLADAFIPIAPILSTDPTADDFPFGSGGGTSSRLELVLELWTHSRSEVFAESAYAIIEKPPVPLRAWRDGTNLVEIVARLRDGGYFDNFPEPERLGRLVEAEIIDLLALGVPTDDLEQIADAVEEAEKLVSQDVVAAVNRAIETEIELAGERAADTDSESTLEERIESLAKMAPRAGVQSDLLDRAIGIITDRIQVIREEASQEEGPSFEPPKKDEDVFDDVQLRDLFASLLLGKA
jgi:hypothetical protein